MKSFAIVLATIFLLPPCAVMLAQQDTGPTIQRLPVGPPAKVQVPPKFNAPYVLLRLSVDENGAAQDVHVTKSAGDALDAKAVKAVSTSRFPQRVQNGKPVKFGLQLAVTMDADSSGDVTAQIHKVTPPLVVFQALPEFSDEARRKHVTGGVLVALVVDEKGRPQNVNVVHGLASGLDEKAIESVRKYRFSPATVEGKAIAFPMNVEVNFQDY